MDDKMTWSPIYLDFDNVLWTNGICGERGQMNFLAALLGDHVSSKIAHQFKKGF